MDPTREAARTPDAHRSFSPEQLRDRFGTQDRQRKADNDQDGKDCGRMFSNAFQAFFSARFRLFPILEERCSQPGGGQAHKEYR